MRIARVRDGFGQWAAADEDTETVASEDGENGEIRVGYVRYTDRVTRLRLRIRVPLLTAVEEETWFF